MWCTERPVRSRDGASVARAARRCCGQLFAEAVPTARCPSDPIPNAVALRALTRCARSRRGRTGWVGRPEVIVVVDATHPMWPGSPLWTGASRSVPAKCCAKCSASPRVACRWVSVEGAGHARRVGWSSVGPRASESSPALRLPCPVSDLRDPGLRGALRTVPAAPRHLLGRGGRTDLGNLLPALCRASPCSARPRLAARLSPDWWLSITLSRRDAGRPDRPAEPFVSSVLPRCLPLNRERRRRELPSREPETVLRTWQVPPRPQGSVRGHSLSGTC